MVTRLYKQISRIVFAFYFNFVILHSIYAFLTNVLIYKMINKSNAICGLTAAALSTET